MSNKKREPLDIDNLDTPEKVRQFLEWLFDPEHDKELEKLIASGDNQEPEQTT